MTDTTRPGTLYIVATPLGNLEDMTFRAVRVLKDADIIAAEDTRHSRKLLSHYGITTPTVSCHEHNEAQRADMLTEKLQQGRDIALITDAGTPCVSDPGYRLVSAAAAQGISVVPIPGCAAAIAGLSASGLPSDRFLFLGFLPKKATQQQHLIQSLANEPATLIFYESPKRVEKLVRTLLDILGDRRACLARELTKRHEEFIRGSLAGILDALAARDTVKGECTLFVRGSNQKPGPVSPGELDELIRARLTGSPAATSAIARDIAAQHNIPRKSVYEAILRLKPSR